MTDHMEVLVAPCEQLRGAEVHRIEHKRLTRRLAVEAATPAPWQRGYHVDVLNEQIEAALGLKEAASPDGLVDHLRGLLVAWGDQQVGVACEGQGTCAFAEAWKGQQQRGRSQDRHAFTLGQRAHNLNDVDQRR